jgi:glutaredoxin
MYATQWCGVCREAREYMKQNRIDFTERDTEGSSAADERLGELNPRKTIPTFELDELVYIGFQEQLFEAKLNQAARKHL